MTTVPTYAYMRQLKFNHEHNTNKWHFLLGRTFQKMLKVVNTRGDRWTLVDECNGRKYYNKKIHQDGENPPYCRFVTRVDNRITRVWVYVLHEGAEHLRLTHDDRRVYQQMLKVVRPGTDGQPWALFDVLNHTHIRKPFRIGHDGRHFCQFKTGDYWNNCSYTHAPGCEYLRERALTEWPERHTPSSFRRLEYLDEQRRSPRCWRLRLYDIQRGTHYIEPFFGLRAKRNGHMS